VGRANTLAQALELVRETGTGSYFVFSKKKTGHKNFSDVVSGGVVISVPASKL